LHFECWFVLQIQAFVIVQDLMNRCVTFR
jgi:hypothetical protein